MSEPELQGWYYQNPSSEAVRVRLSVVERSLLLHTLSDRLIASWSLDRLENRRTPLLGERWSIGDPHLPEAHVVLESDRDYEAMRMVSPELRAARAAVASARLFGNRVRQGSWLGYIALARSGRRGRSAVEAVLAGPRFKARIQRIAGSATK